MGEEKGADENYFLALSREENQRKIKNIPRILKNTGRRPEEDRKKTVSAPAKLNAQNPARINARSQNNDSKNQFSW